MAAVNYRGIDNVCKYIESTKMVYFAIFPVGKTSAKPLYKQFEKTTSIKAAERFRDWANVLLDGDPAHNEAYELRMYDSKENADGEDEILSGRSGMVVTFALTAANNSQQQTYHQPQAAQGVSLEMYLNVMEQKNDALRELDRLKFENNELRKQVIEMEEELSEAEESVSGTGLGGLEQLLVPFLAQQMAPQGAVKTNINGLPTEAHADTCYRCDEVSPKLMQALKELQKYDNDLTQHLEKLAKVAQNSPAQFKFLLNALDNF